MPRLRMRSVSQPRKPTRVQMKRTYQSSRSVIRKLEARLTSLAYFRRSAEAFRQSAAQMAARIELTSHANATRERAWRGVTLSAHTCNGEKRERNARMERPHHKFVDRLGADDLAQSDLHLVRGLVSERDDAVRYRTE